MSNDNSDQQNSIKLVLEFTPERDGRLYHEINKYFSGSNKRNRGTMIKILLREYWMESSNQVGQLGNVLSSSKQSLTDRSSIGQSKNSKESQNTGSKTSQKTATQAEQGTNFMDELKNDKLELNFG